VELEDKEAKDNGNQHFRLEIRRYALRRGMLVRRGGLRGVLLRRVSERRRCSGKDIHAAARLRNLPASDQF
jgi:hypothetical protein